MTTPKSINGRVCVEYALWLGRHTSATSFRWVQTRLAACCIKTVLVSLKKMSLVLHQHSLALASYDFEFESNAATSSQSFRKERISSPQMDGTVRWGRRMHQEQWSSPDENVRRHAWTIGDQLRMGSFREAGIVSPSRITGKSLASITGIRYVDLHSCQAYTLAANDGEGYRRCKTLNININIFKVI